MTTSAETAASLLRPHEEKTERPVLGVLNERTKLSKYMASAKKTWQILPNTRPIIHPGVNQMNISCPGCFSPFWESFRYNWIFFGRDKFFRPIQYSSLPSQAGAKEDVTKASQQVASKSHSAGGSSVLIADVFAFSVRQWFSVLGTQHYLAQNRLGGGIAASLAI